MLGYCDSGYRPEEDGKEPSEVLIFMLTGLKGPVAYFFTASLCSKALQELLLHNIETLHHHGFSIPCITMDGHDPNLVMCRGLGAQMNLKESVRQFFILNGQKIFVLLNPCHMIKLTRKMVHALGVIKSEAGLIRWDCIEKLHSKQTEISLRSGNKITSRHVEFQQIKMKISFIMNI